MSRAEELKARQFDESEWRKLYYSISNNTLEDDLKPSSIYKKVKQGKK
jgi:hypothetical protein